MSPQSKARIWLRPERRRGGRVTHAAVWLILDGYHQESTRCGREDAAGAERKLAGYLARKHVGSIRRLRDPAEIPIADVIALYSRDVAPKHARPHETIRRLEFVLAFFGDRMLDAITGDLCRAYVAQRSTKAMARKELSDLRAAINYHRGEGYCEKLVHVSLPEKSPPREEWLTRSEAAALIWHAWRYREVQKGHPTGRRSRQHVARFILVALYTGTRAAMVCAAALDRVEGHGFIDLSRGIYFRRPAGFRDSKKRRPPVPLPRRLIAHLRRWQRRGQRFAVEWNGRPVRDVDKAFRATVAAAGLRETITPHVLRHTAATWLMQQGADPWQAAEYLGMTLKTLTENYGHHHPDYLDGPRSVFDRAPIARQRSRANGVN